MESGHTQLANTNENGIEIMSIVRHMYIRNDDVTSELADILCSEDFDSKLECFLERFDDLNSVGPNSHALIHCLANTKPLTNVTEFRRANVAKCVSELAKRGMDLDTQDDTGNTALHYAAKNEDQCCSDALIREGADLCVKNLEGGSAISEVLKHLPNSFKALEARLDRGIIMNRKNTKDDDPISDGTTVILDFNVLLSKIYDHPSDGNILSEILKEDEESKGIYDTERKYLENVFLHPLTECFLKFKWHRVRLQYWGHLISHIIFSLIYSAYIHEVYGVMCDPKQIASQWNGTDWLHQSVHWNKSIDYDIPCVGDIGNKKTPITDLVHTLWGIVLVFLAIYTLKEITLLSYFKLRYFSTWENRMSLLLLLTFPLIVFHKIPKDHINTHDSASSLMVNDDKLDNTNSSTIDYDEQLETIKLTLSSNYTGDYIPFTVKYYEYHAAAIGILLTWTLNMLYVARSPIFGRYIRMMVKVGINFLKFFIAISSLLIAFATSFSVMFPRETSLNNMSTSFLKVLSMMVGEIGYNDLLYRTHWIVKETNENNRHLDTDVMPQIFPITTLFLVNTFILIFSIIIMNLFLGIAVNEVSSIFKFGMLHQNIKMVQIIQIYEKTRMLWLYLTPSCLHQFIKLQPLYKGVRKNVCEVDLCSHGKEKIHISRHLKKRIMTAIERTRDEGQTLPTLLDIMKMVEANKTMIEKLLEQKMNEHKD